MCPREGRTGMKGRKWVTGLATALAALSGTAAVAAGSDIVIGDIDDLSGTYADAQGVGGIEAIKMAIADFGGTVLGKKIVLLTADHQNKPDGGASKFRERSDHTGLHILIC